MNFKNAQETNHNSHKNVSMSVQCIDALFL